MQTSKADSHTLYYTGIYRLFTHAVHDRRQLTQSEKGWGADHMGHCQGVPCCLDSNLAGTACDQTCLYLWETNPFWAEQSCCADPEPSDKILQLPHRGDIDTQAASVLGNKCFGIHCWQQ